MVFFVFRLLLNYISINLSGSHSFISIKFQQFKTVFKGLAQALAVSQKTI